MPDSAFLKISSAKLEYAFLKAGFSQSTTAFEIDVHKSTVSREIRRNLGKKGYRLNQAHVIAITRHHRADKFVKMTHQLLAIIGNLIRNDYSPQHISDALKRNHRIRISHETIYQHILSDKTTGGILYQHLRGSNRIRKKRYGSQSLRGQIPGRVSIDSSSTPFSLETSFSDSA
ncbi:MAG TPA: IS30 family transposase [Desulfobacterales bacterium]|nr:IS30 family transposase [Desulfobacterales bacterium]